MGGCKICIGLVVTQGKEFLDTWLDTVNRFGDFICVVDNDADPEVREAILKHPKLKQYRIQKKDKVNMSRDYQQILDMARDEHADWVWILDIDKYIPEVDNEVIKNFLIDYNGQSLGYALF